jgi:tetratricopeptide (TPR) repeat protein
MNAAMTMETCPDVETLAAFSDGALDEKTRLEVLQHIADCGQCQDDLVELDAAKRELKLEPANVRRGSFGRWIAPLAAAAAVVVVLFGVPSIRERLFGTNGMAELVEAGNSLSERTTAARLTGDFAHKEYRAMRGLGEDSNLTDYRLAAAVANASERVERNPSVANLHAYGVASILTKDRDKAVSALQRAVNAGTPSAALLTDLSAAYIARGRQGDAEAALNAANKAWTLEQTPVAAWNRAIALESLERDEDAVAAWHEYRRLDATSAWSEEAMSHLQRLDQQ